MQTRAGFFLSLLLPAVLPSCGGASGDMLSPDDPEYLTVTLSAGNVSLVTKGDGASDPTACVNSLQAFAFRSSDGSLSACSFSRDGDSVSLTLPVSQDGTDYRFVAVANNWDPSAVSWRHDLSACASRDAVLSAVTDLADNAGDGTTPELLMCGERDVTLVRGTREVSVGVSRLAAKVEIRRVSVSLEDGVMAGRDLVLDSVYVCNAGARCTFGGAVPEPLQLLDRGGWSPGGASSLLGMKVSEVIHRGSDGSSPGCSRTGTFYTYPNASEESPTRLVLRCTLGGDEVMYYPVTIDTVKSGHAYIIKDAVITGRGSSGPDEPLDAGRVTVSVTVLPWDEVLLGDNGSVEF